MAKVAWIGLGVMGYPMAGYHASKGGHEVRVYNRTKSKAEQWVEEHGGTVCATPHEAVQGADAVFACVGNDDDLRAVTIGEQGAFSGMAEGTLFVDHTTASAEVARELHKQAAIEKIGFVDAPVSGGQAGAENGVLTVMCGGNQDDYNQAESYIKNYAKTCRRLGDVGSGQLTKMVNQILIAGLVQGLSEGIAFGQKAGLPMNDVIDIIGGGAAQSWQLDNRGKTMVKNEFDFGFAVEWMRKDLGICLETAQQIGASLPITALTDQFYGEVTNNGGKRWDTSSLITRLNKP